MPVFTDSATVQVSAGCASQEVALTNAVAIGNGIRSLTTGIAGAEQITNMVKMTKAQYDALATKDSNTIYVIRG